MNKSRTDFLFATPSFLYGMGTVLDISGTFYSYNGSESADEADFIALQEDFNVIGQDLSVAFKAETEKVATDKLAA